MTLQDSTNSTTTNAEPVGVGLHGRAVSPGLANGADILCGQLAVRIALAALVALSALGGHISHVVLVGAEEQVCRVDASAHITAVTDMHTIRDAGTMVNFPGSAVGEKVLFVQPKLAVPGHAMRAGHPGPAFVGTPNVSLAPEPIVSIFPTPAMFTMDRAWQ